LSQGAVVKLVANPPRGALIVSPGPAGIGSSPGAHPGWQVVATHRLGLRSMLWSPAARDRELSGLTLAV